MQNPMLTFDKELITSFKGNISFLAYWVHSPLCTLYCAPKFNQLPVKMHTSHSKIKMQV